MDPPSMSASVASARSSSSESLERAVGELREHAAAFAGLSPKARAELVRACIPRLLEVAAAWSAAGLRAKGLPADSAEEWLSGPMPTARHLRLLADSLDSIAVSGRPPLGTSVRQRDDGRLEVAVFPGSGLDRALYRGFTGYALLQRGVDLEQAVQAQAPFYSQFQPQGRVALILGAGNASSIPAMDVLTKMFNEGMVCVLKMNPVNEWVGPYLERTFEPLINRGFLAVVYGGADVGHLLVNHDGIEAVHLTGSAKTHDALVWGPPGPDHDRRRAANQPLLSVPITSELGNVTPYAVVPYRYSTHELAFQAQNIATMVANNVSFNCVAAKMLITARGWPQRNALLDLVAGFLAEMPHRVPYYPGAADRYQALTASRNTQTIGPSIEGRLPWTLLRDLDPADPDDPLFRTEPFCPIVSETSLGSADPEEFLDSATTFMNDTLWGTLSATLAIHPRLERDPAVAAALDRSITELRYGTVAINHWSALGYGLPAMPWGGHPSTTLQDVQSGIGWVHNTYLLGQVEKAVLRGGLTVSPTPVWFSDNNKAAAVGSRLVDIEARPRWRKVPGLLRRLL